MDKGGGTSPNSGNLFKKVISMAAGEAHTLALAGDGSVYSWGRGTFGRLGTGSEADELFPVRIEFDSNNSEERVKIVGISAGAYHSQALADDGSVWSWGYNTSVSKNRYVVILDYYMDGQLGIVGENSLVPRLVEGFLELSLPGSSGDSEAKTKPSLKISAVKAGGMTSLAIDNLGGLWVWGNCPSQNNSAVGEFLLISSSSPIPVWNFHGHTVVKVACGNEHILALVSAGETHKGGGDLVCYSWGNNNHGQLGLGDTESRLNPEILETFNSESHWEVYNVACGAFHTALLAHRKSRNETLESVCWTFGLGENGQLGHGTTKSELYPEVVDGLPKNVFLISIDCGLFHTSVVSSSGEVWSWGMEKGLGLCPDASFTGTDAGDALSPLLILCSGLYGRNFPEPVQVACGAAHTVLLADAGYKLWSWGRGRSGVLGNGKTDDYYSPNIVLWPPLAVDFKEDIEIRDVRSERKRGEKDPEEIAEIDKGLHTAIDEIKLLKSKLSIMERYASILHGSIFGKPLEEQDLPVSLSNSGTFDIAKEWEEMLESSDRGKLIRLEMFYRSMLAGVKDKLMKQRIKEIIKECLDSTATGD